MMPSRRRHQEPIPLIEIKYTSNAGGKEDYADYYQDLYDDDNLEIAEDDFIHLD
jgi:hypothetical protein